MTLGQQGRGGEGLLDASLFDSSWHSPVERGPPSLFGLSPVQVLASTLGSKHVYQQTFHEAEQRAALGGHIIYGALRRGAALGRGSLGGPHEPVWDLQSE